MSLENQYTQEELDRIGYLIALNRKIRFTGKDLGLTNRQVTNWNKEGMFIDPIVEGKRKEFDFVESVWVRLAMELQDYGFSFEEIKVYKKEFCHSDTMELIQRVETGDLTRNHPAIAGVDKFVVDGKQQDIDMFFEESYQKTYQGLNSEDPHVLLNLFTHIIMASLRIDAYHIAFAHGGVIKYDWSYTVDKTNDKGENENITRDRLNWKSLMPGTGLIVSLDEILTSLILTEPRYKKNPRPINFFLSEKEIEVIELLREHKDCKTFEIQIEDQEPVRVEITGKKQYVTLQTKLATLIRKNSFGEITIKHQNGHVNYAAGTISIKLNTSKEN